MQLENFLGGAVAEYRGLNISDVLRESGTTAIVIGAGLDIVRIASQPGIVLLSTEEGTHGDQVHNVPPRLGLGIRFFRSSIEQSVHFFLAVEP